MQPTANEIKITRNKRYRYSKVVTLASRKSTAFLVPLLLTSEDGVEVKVNKSEKTEK
jgi:hypothetical protein